MDIQTSTFYCIYYDLLGLSLQKHVDTINFQYAIQLLSVITKLFYCFENMKIQLIYKMFEINIPFSKIFIELCLKSYSVEQYVEN